MKTWVRNAAIVGVIALAAVSLLREPARAAI